MTKTSVARSTGAEPVPEIDTNKNPDEMSFLEHLEALRWHIIRALSSVLVIGVTAFAFKSFIFDDLLLGPTKQTFITYRWFCDISDTICFYPEGLEIITRDISEQFLSHIKVSIWLGIIVAFPYIFYEFWKFVKPGLYSTEQKAAKGVVFISSTLFLSGILFGYFVIAPFAVTFLSSYSVSPDILNTTTLTSLVNSMTMFTIPTGIIFELPIVIYFLAKVGLVTSATMKQYRKHAVVIILILSAIITPPDVITQFLIGLPLYLLFEAGIVIAKRVEKNQAKENGGN
ncbi:MAG: twin-arginine translocase subunit TatC [Bacteroidetes bacterium]|nr:MAG: twin-arginine translocase subunit TatC [Bacteroidota bacterium]